MIKEISIILCLLFSTSAQKLIDLGHDLSQDTPLFPHPAFVNKHFNLTVMHSGFTPGGFWLAFNSFCSIEHIGTHVDAPIHFAEHGWTMEQIPVERLIAPAIVIDVLKKVENDSNYLVSSSDVDDWTKANGPLPNNSVVLIHTGWNKRYPDQLQYYGHDSDPTKAVFPGMDPEAVKKIHSMKDTHGIHVYGFGTDSPSIDNGPSQDFQAHQTIQAENQYIIENLNNLDKLPPKGAILFVMPMKIKGGTGAPARVIAQLP